MQAIIKELLGHTSEVCLSLIFPTHYTSFDEKKRVEIVLAKGLKEAEKKLYDAYERKVAKSVLARLHGLIAQVDLKHPPQGVGFFVVPDFARQMAFSFPVAKKVVVSDIFEVQDILYNLDKMIHYHVLHLSEKHTRLFEGIGPHLTEVSNSDFPKMHEEEYQVSRSSPHSLYQDDPSHVKQQRRSDFFRKVCHEASPYVQQGPLVVIGLDKDMHDYVQYSRKDVAIIAKVAAHYDHLPLPKINDLVWPIVEDYQNEKERTLHQLVKQKVVAHQAIYGIKDVLDRMAGVGPIGHLVVERDFDMPGYLHRGSKKIVLQPLNNDKAAYEQIPNVVGHIIAQGIRRGAKVDMVTASSLEALGHIVLLA